MLTFFAYPLAQRVIPTLRRLQSLEGKLDGSHLDWKALHAILGKSDDATINTLRNAPAGVVIKKNGGEAFRGTFGDAIVVSHYLRTKVVRMIKTFEHQCFVILLMVLVAFAYFALHQSSSVLSLGGIADFGAWMLKYHLLPLGEVFSLALVIFSFKEVFAEIFEALDNVSASAQA